jgi:dihydrofolate reductase
MREITASLFITLDGVVGGEEEMATWHFPSFSPDLGQAATGPYAECDTILLGRRTYDSFAGAWPGRETAGEEDAPFAAQLGDMRKVVVSRSPLEFTWRNSEQLAGDLVTGVAALKDESGEGIVIPGSVSVVRVLLTARLVDRLHLMVHPIAMRTGFKLFDEGAPPVHFDLVSAEPMAMGVLNLMYVTTAAPAAAGYDEAKQHLPDADG